MYFAASKESLYDPFKINLYDRQWFMIVFFGQ